MDGLRRVFEDVALLVTGVFRPLLGSLRDNSGLAVLSVVLAFGLWIFVTDAENPTRPGVVRDPIPVEAVNVPPDVWVPDVIGTVQLRVRVEENVFGSLRKEDFQAVVDLENLAVGSYELTVDVRALTDRGGLRIEEVLPDDQIDVDLAQLVSKSVPVVVEVEGSVPPDYALSQPVPEEESVVVSGPQDGVDLVTQAVARIDVGGRTERVEQAVRMEPRDQRGQLVEGVSVDPALTQVSLEIEQKQFSRALVISPQIVGSPAQGYNVVRVSVIPNAITVSGEQSFIDEAVTIKTQPIDIEGADEYIVRTVSLDVPPGTKVIGNIGVTVTVEIVPALGQFVFAIPVGLTGLDGALSLSGAPPTVQVNLFGPLPQLLGLNPNDIAASADVDGKDAGTHKVKIKVTAPEGLEVRSVSPEEIEITLENR